MNLVLTTAKPYAKAIFDLALAQNKLSEWLRSLKTLAKFVIEIEKEFSLGDPAINTKQRLDLFSEFTNRSQELKNLIKLLIERKKLGLLPDIATSYQQLFFTHQKILEVKIVSAQKLTTTQKKQFLDTLGKRYQSKILLQCYTDPGLLGGAMIYIKDEVIDASIKGTLLRLKQNLLLKNNYAKTK